MRSDSCKRQTPPAYFHNSQRAGGANLSYGYLSTLKLWQILQIQTEGDVRSKTDDQELRTKLKWWNTRGYGGEPQQLLL